MRAGKARFFVPAMDLEHEYHHKCHSEVPYLSARLTGVAISAQVGDEESAPSRLQQEQIPRVLFAS